MSLHNLIQLEYLDWDAELAIDDSLRNLINRRLHEGNIISRIVRQANTRLDECKRVDLLDLRFASGITCYAYNATYICTLHGVSRGHNPNQLEDFGIVFWMLCLHLLCSRAVVYVDFIRSVVS